MTAMESYFQFTLFFLVIWLSLYGIYWVFVRPVFQAKLQVELSKIQDEILLMSKRDNDAATQILLTRCVRVRASVSIVSLDALAITDIPADIDEQFKREKLILSSANERIQALTLKLSLILVFGLLANSPLLLLIGLCMASIKELFSGTKSKFNSFVDFAWENSILAMRKKQLAFG
jgi:hypothetical protein